MLGNVEEDGGKELHEVLTLVLLQKQVLNVEESLQLCVVLNQPA